MEARDQSVSRGDDSECADMELAYRQALQALDEAERQVGSALVDFAADLKAAAEEDSPASGMSIGEQLAEDLDATANSAADGSADLVSGFRRVSQRQVIEAALFVGGDVALTARRLSSLIGQDVDPRVAVSVIDSLNQTWARENRPYEIRLHEGGYRMELREQFRDVSMRMFGLGPKEVRLSPDVLEVLAWVAYNQPVNRDDMGQLDRPNVLSILRQLIRLQLVELQRTGSGRADVCYATTDRFLKLFGLKSLAELPVADVFSFK